MEIIAIAVLATVALLVFQQRKGPKRRLERVRARRNTGPTHRQTHVPDDRC